MITVDVKVMVLLMVVSSSLALLEELQTVVYAMIISVVTALLEPAAAVMVELWAGQEVIEAAQEVTV